MVLWARCRNRACGFVKIVTRPGKPSAHQPSMKGSPCGVRMLECSFSLPLFTNYHRTVPFNPSFEVFTAATMTNAVFGVVKPCGSCKNDILEERIASIIRIKRISELGRTLVITSNVPPKPLFLQEPHCMLQPRRRHCSVSFSVFQCSDYIPLMHY
jgi:hypothetical protein